MKRYETSEKGKANRRKSYVKRRDRIKAIINEAKSVPCADCGKTYPPWVMDFHHLRDKEFTMKKAMCVSFARLQAELRKCIVLCSNCHRERTHNEETSLSGT